MKRSICIDGKIFEYDLTYKKIKNLNLRIRPNGAITVSAPMRFPVKKIDTFVIGKSDFITSALERFENIRKLYNFQGLREGNELFVLGEPYRIKRELANICEVILSEDKIAIIRSPDDSEDAAKKAVMKLYDTISRTHIYALCEQVHKRFEECVGDMPEIKFRRAYGRWGSCYSRSKKIILNKFLAAVPSECIEYVIYHEFVHFLHPDHSADFYRELDAYCPEHKCLKKSLETYSSVLEFMK